MSTPSVLPGVTMQRRAVGSFYSAFVGWVTVIGLYLLAMLLDRSPGPDPGFRSPLFIAWYSAIAAAFIFGTWLVALLPLYLLVPLHSPLWRWPVCTVCGTVSGAAILVGFYWLISPSPIYWHWDPSITAAAIVGGVTCLFGSLTRRFFLVPVPPNNALQRTGGGGGVPPEFDY